MICFWNRKFYAAACAVLLSVLLTLGVAASALPGESNPQPVHEDWDWDMDIDGFFDDWFEGGLYGDGWDDSAPGEDEAEEGQPDILYSRTPPSGGVPVRIRNDQVPTFPASTNTNIPSPNHYPLPKDTIDYVVSGDIEYTSPSGAVFKYRILGSGLRVETRHLRQIEKGPRNNAITSMSFNSSNDRYTYLMLKTEQRVPFSVTYRDTAFQIQFHYTTSAPNSANLSNNNRLFTKAVWEDQSKLTLTFANKHGFMGYRAYYDRTGNLIFRFNNPPKSIKDAVIAIDPGHGGKDPGALGTDRNWPERTINLAIAKKLEAELKKRGAKVTLMNNAGYEREQRAVRARKIEPHMLISIHANTAPSRSAAGTETYFHHPYSSRLAVNSSANVARAMATNNRRARQSHFGVTLLPEFLSVLVEVGFMTNQTEYRKLRDSRYHDRVAAAIANSIEGAIRTANTGEVSSGNRDLGPAPRLSGSDDVESTRPPQGNDTGQEETGPGTSDSPRITSISIEEDYYTVMVGERQEIRTTLRPSRASRSDITWSSSNDRVATVDSNGRVRGIREGTVTITARSRHDSSVRATCEVDVVREGYSDDTDPIEQIFFEYHTLEYSRGDEDQLFYGVEPRDAQDAAVVWTSSNSNIVSVDRNGNVRMRNRGTATIRVASAADSRIYDECTITVH